MARSLTGDKGKEDIVKTHSSTLVIIAGLCIGMSIFLISDATSRSGTRYITYQDSYIHTVVPAWSFANLGDVTSESLRFTLDIDNGIDIETKMYPGVGCPTMPKLDQLMQDETDTMERAQYKPVITIDWQVSDVTGIMLSGNTTKTVRNGGKSLQVNLHESVAIFQNVCVTWRIYEYSDDSHRDQVHDAFLKVLNNITFTEHQTGG